MKLIYKINLFLFIFFVITATFSIVLYNNIKNNYVKKDAVNITSRFNGVLEANYPLFVGDIAKNNTDLLFLRLQFLSANYRQDDLFFRYSNSGKSVIYQTKNLKLDKNFENSIKNQESDDWKLNNDRLWKTYNINFADKNYGVLVVSIKPSDNKFNFIKTSFQMSMILFISFFLINLLFLQFFISREVVKPLRLFIEKLPFFRRYIQGEDEKLPTDFSSVKSQEFKHVFSVFSQFVVKLKNSLQREQESLAQLEKEKATRQTMEAIAQTVQMVSHDVRKPLSMTHSIMEILSSAKTPDDVCKLIQECKPDLERAFQTVNGFLSDLILAGGHISLHKKDTDINELLKSIIHDLKLSHPKLEQKITVEFSEIQTLSLDSFKIMRAFTNILNNAIQATNRTKGYIAVKTKQTKEAIIVTVSNTTSFIPENKISKLFDSFFTEGKIGGSGLGLAIAKRMLEAHGGHILCRSFKNENYPDGFVEFEMSFLL